MGQTRSFFYTLTLSLWTGGMAIFTFIVTPAIFRSYGRDQAGEIVGRLFPGYFLYLLVLSALALLLFFLVSADQSARAFRASLFLLVVAIIINAYVLFSLHPKTVQVKQQVVSFEAAAADSPARKEFRRLHALSAVLNLTILADGVALLALSRNLFSGRQACPGNLFLRTSSYELLPLSVRTNPDFPFPPLGVS